MLLQSEPNGNSAARGTGASSVSSRPDRVRSGTDFLRTLFQFLEEFKIRYCVLHSWKGLPEKLPNILDLAIHSEDKDKLLIVFETLLDLGYQPLQRLNRLGNTYHLLFLWFENTAPKVLAVNLIFGNGQSRAKLPFGDAILTIRRRHGNFYVAETATEFTFLLSKIAGGESAPKGCADQLMQLSAELGAVRTEKLCVEVLPKKWASQVAEACANGSIDEILKEIGPLPLWEAPLRHPLKLFRYLAVKS